MNKSAENTFLLMLMAMVASATMIAQHIAGKATRDALFLTYFDVTSLPAMMMVSAAVSVAAVLLMSKLLARFGPAHLVPIIYALSAALLVLQWLLMDSQPKIASAALYVQVASINSVLISGFWSVINERFDPYSAKTVIARIAAAATFGGLAGGLLAKLVADFADTQAILIMLCGMHVLCGFAVAYIGRGTKVAQHSEESPGNLLAPLRRSPLIRRMAVLALLVATTAAMLDYVLKAEAAAELSPEQLITFFSYFYVAVGLFGFLLQSSIGDKALKWFGLGGAMMVWPLVILTTGIATLVFRSLVTAALMRGSANIFYNSFFRTGFELLYTPIPPEDKRTGKVMIDVGADRSGDLIGGLIVMAILMLPAFSETILMVVALMLAVVIVLVIMVLQRNYVGQLADNLRGGEANITDEAASFSSISHSLAPPEAPLQRDELLREIERHRRQVESAGETPLTEPRDVGGDVVLESIATLRNDDESAIRRVLMSRPLTAELVPHAVNLLGSEAVLHETLRALKGVASASAGQLVDALSDPFTPELVRRRLPLVLAYSDSPIAVHGLDAALSDSSWNVRFRSARALNLIRRHNPRAKIAESHLVAVAQRELAAIAGNGRDQDISPAHRLELVFFLIGATGEPDTVELCWQAVHGDDRRLRGTAYEYLENRLPDELWEMLLPLLDSDAVHIPGKGSARKAAKALHAAAGQLRDSVQAAPRDRLADAIAHQAGGVETGNGHGKESPQ